MPNTKSAKKALRVSLRKRKVNKAKNYKIKNSLKEFRRVLATNPKEYKDAMSKVYSALDKAVKTNFIHKKRADRKKSRISKMVEKALSSVDSK